MNKAESTTYANHQIVIPVYNDWESVKILLKGINEQYITLGEKVDVLLVDDGSRLQPGNDWPEHLKQISEVRILTLRRNLGHQRAICVGLCHLCAYSDCTSVVIMDGDGEDDPSDIPRLLKELQENPDISIVFAERRKRSEGLVFTFFYQLYSLLHVLFVGQRVRVGNFSAINRRCLEGICCSWELWNHYAAAIFASRMPRSKIPTHRAKRLAGRSKMNFPSLVMHGLSALSVFSDRIGTRLLIFSSVLAFLTLLGMGLVVSIRLTTGFAIPGWATNAFGLLALFLAQIVGFIITFCFFILFSRTFSPFIPIRDFVHYVRSVKEVENG